VPRPPLRSQRLPTDGLWGNWRERAEVLVLARPLSRGLLAAAAAAALVVGLAPLAFLIASSFVVGDLRAGAAGGWHSPGGQRLSVALGAAAGIFVVWQVAAPVQGTIGRLVTRSVDGDMRRRLLAAGVAGPSVAALEDAELAAHLSEASSQLEHNPNTPGMALAGLFMLSGTYIQVTGAVVVVALAFSPWAAAVLLAGAWAWRYGHRSALVRLEAAHGVSEPQRRVASYLRRVGLDPASGKETRLFALAPWIRDRYRRESLEAAAKLDEVQSWLFGARMLRFALTTLVSSMLVLVWVARSAAHGHVPLRDLALTLTVGGLLVQSARSLPEIDEPLHWGMYLYRELAAFEAGAARHAASAGGTRDPVGFPRDSIRFEAVSFCYPGSHRAALDGLDLEIEAGRSLAIVGLNGAGKTTLVKLLARLYEPDSGRITADGVDLRQFDASRWQRRVAAIFQDFVRYELSAAENIGLGAVERQHDLAAVRRAAGRAGALETLEALSSGFDTILSSRYDGGSDLSGGEWQRVALARALFAVDAGASVLILDEPTASLDIRAERDFYNRFLDLTAGATTILISHRLSTVRRADRIAVLDGGRVVELGSHEALLAAGGRYAALYRLQARQFEDGNGEWSDDRA
jgi:ATP-binding cassette subfamily B protein